MRTLPGLAAALLLVVLPALAGCVSTVTDSGETLTPTQLRYRLDTRYQIFYCDPDYWPVARDDEQQRALERFPEIAADEERFAAILQHLDLTAVTAFTDEQKLAIYRESKRLDSIVLEPADGGYKFQLRASTAEKYFSVTGEIASSGRIAAEHWQPGSNICPICLTGDTHIATARGAVPVQELVPGDLVWSLDARGARVLSPLRRTARAPLVGAVPMLRVRLEDGLELVASGAHPMLDGGHLSDLRARDSLGGHRVESVTLRYLRLGATYDLLPASSTGAYWANDVLLASTLR